MRIWASCFDAGVVDVHQVRREEQVEGVPSDRSGEVTLQGSGELDDLLDQHLRVLGRLGDAQRVGEVETELLDVLDRLPGTVRSVDHAQVVKVNVTAHVGVCQILAEHLEQGELLLDVLSESEIGGLRAVRDVRVLLVGTHDDLPRVVQRNAEAGVLLADLGQSILDKLGVGQLPDQWCGDHLDLKL